MKLVLLFTIVGTISWFSSPAQAAKVFARELIKRA